MINQTANRYYKNKREAKKSMKKFQTNTLRNKEGSNYFVEIREVYQLFEGKIFKMYGLYERTNNALIDSAGVCRWNDIDPISEKLRFNKLGE